MDWGTAHPLRPPLPGFVFPCLPVDPSELQNSCCRPPLMLCVWWCLGNLRRALSGIRESLIWILKRGPRFPCQGLSTRSTPGGALLPSRALHARSTSGGALFLFRELRTRSTSGSALPALPDCLVQSLRSSQHLSLPFRLQGLCTRATAPSTVSRPSPARLSPPRLSLSTAGAVHPQQPRRCAAQHCPTLSSLAPLLPHPPHARVLSQTRVARVGRP